MATRRMTAHWVVFAAAAPDTAMSVAALASGPGQAASGSAALLAAASMNAIASHATLIAGRRPTA
jgi:hypothetical protein